MKKLFRIVKKRHNAYILGGFFIILFMSNIIGITDYLLTISFAKYKHRGPDQPLEWLIHSFKSKLILPTNPYNHPYTILNNKCGNKSAPNDIVIVVKSKLQNLCARKLIRDTWGNMTRYKNFSAVIVFMIGAACDHGIKLCSWSDYEVQKEIIQENDRYGDILQGGFFESYYNLTIKTQMGLHWLNTHCDHFKYALFVDDDVYLSPTNVLRYLIDPPSFPSNRTIKETDTISGENQHFWAGRVPLLNCRIPIRYKFSKWAVSLEDYPYTVYPPFIQGGVQVMSRHSLQKLYYASIFTGFYK